MSILANALTDYRVPDFRNQAAVIALLTPTLPAVRAVADYWRAAQPEDRDDVDAWSVYFRQSSTDGDYLRYDGPASFSVSFGERVARVSGPCRWSGFCTMAALQQAHLTAFRVISRALGGGRMALIPEFDPVFEVAFYDGGGLDECVSFLEQRWGAPQPTTAVVTDDVQVLYRREHPAWFVERL